MSNSFSSRGSPDAPTEGSATATQQASQIQSSFLQNSSLNYGTASDEIDLVELIGFFWKIKIEIVAGLVVGILAGALVAFRFLPVTYKSQFPLSLDKNEPTPTDPKKFVENFNMTLNSTETARLIWGSVFNQSPEFAKILKEAHLSDESLAVQQTLSANPEKVPMRLRESGSPRDFIFEVTLPVQGLPSRSGELFATAIQTTLFVANSSDTDKGKSSDKRKNLLSSPVHQSAGNSPAASSIERSDEFREQLVKAKQDYLKIEFLLNKLSRGLPETASFLSLAENDLKAVHFSLSSAADSSVSFIAEAQEQFVVQAQYERMQRMVALLLAEGRMTNDKANETVQRAQQIRDELLQLIPLARQEAQRAGVFASRRRLVGKDDARLADKNFSVPLLVSANLGALNTYLEEPISKRKVGLVLGAFLGAFAGFALGGLRVFIQKNGKRLREVLAQ